jgi:hypothetical protein
MVKPLEYSLRRLSFQMYLHRHLTRQLLLVNQKNLSRRHRHQPQ